MDFIDRRIKKKEPKTQIGTVNLDNGKELQLFVGKETNWLYVKRPVKNHEIIQQVPVNMFLDFYTKRISLQEMLAYCEGHTIEMVREFTGSDDPINHIYISGKDLKEDDELVLLSFKVPTIDTLCSFKLDVKEKSIGKMKPSCDTFYSATEHDEIMMYSCFGNISLRGINSHENIHDVIIWKEDAEFLKGLLKHYITDLLYEMSLDLKKKAIQAEKLSENISLC